MTQRGGLQLKGPQGLWPHFSTKTVAHTLTKYVGELGQNILN